MSALVACGDASTPAEATADARAMTWNAASENELYRVTLAPRNGEVPIAAFHEWIIEVRDADNAPVHPAQIAFDGAMPAHGHGLPTAPQVTDHLGEGRYRLEGVRFNMAGRWSLMVSVQAAAGLDRAQFEIELAL
ncbi:MAG: FixH family protein [Gammaproteobacteria bacterium]